MPSATTLSTIRTSPGELKMGRATMGGVASGAAYVRVRVSLATQHPLQRRLAQAGLVGLLATTILAAAPDAHARITKIQIAAQGMAFGGYAFAGVGRYEFITGSAFGEVDPKNP